MSAPLSWPPPTPSHQGHLHAVPDLTPTPELGAALADLARLERAPITVRADPQVEHDGLALVQAARLAAEVEARLAEYHRGEAARHEVRRHRFEAIADSAERVVLA